MCENPDSVRADLKTVEAPPRQDDVEQRNANGAARATAKPDGSPTAADGEAPPKKRKTRRGKTKRRCVQPYNKNDRKSAKMNKAKAPYNSNQFLLEDHGNIEELDQRLKYNDLASTSAVTRTRDSSFSVDSDGEFYSSPDDEEEFLIKDFDDQYERLHAERLQSMSKAQLIQEYILLEGRVEVLTKHLRKITNTAAANNREQPQPELQREVERLTIENETLRRENSDLRSKISSMSETSDSEDSETDSSDSCSSSTSSMSRPESPVADYAQTNGHSPNNLQVV